MSEYNEVVADGRDDPFDAERRGYSRRQVDEYIAWRNGQIRDLENRLGQSLTEIERLRSELTEAREAGGRPAYEEVSERVGQILKLADDEARAERDRGAAEVAKMRDLAKAETDKLKADVKDETDRLRSEAQDRAERMLTAAQEQSDRAISSARAEADALLTAAQQSAEQTVADATSHADNTVAVAMAQAKQQLDDATARATAIHDGAERRLNLLISRHTETVRRLTEIRDVVTSLVAGETARGSLEDEVNRTLAAQAGTNSADGRQSSGPHDSSHAGAHRAPNRQVGVTAPAGPTDGGRRVVPSAPLDSHPEPASPRTTVKSHTLLDHDQSDPFGTERGGVGGLSPMASTERGASGGSSPLASTERGASGGSSPLASTDRGGVGGSSPLASTDRGGVGGSSPLASTDRRENARHPAQSGDTAQMPADSVDPEDIRRSSDSLSR